MEGKAMKNCEKCPYGTHPDPSSDICDGCRSDPDTGWGGFTDHAAGKHFNTKQEQEEWYKKHMEDENKDEDGWLNWKN